MCYREYKIGTIQLGCSRLFINQKRFKQIVSALSLWLRLGLVIGGAGINVQRDMYLLRASYSAITWNCAVVEI